MFMTDGKFSMKIKNAAVSLLLKRVNAFGKLVKWAAHNQIVEITAKSSNFETNLSARKKGKYRISTFANKIRPSE